MKLYLAFLLLSFSLKAQEYSLINFSPNQKRTERDILKETNFQRSQLRIFHCDKRDRLQLFSDYRRPNLKGDSLKTIHKNKVIAYIQGDFYDLNGFVYKNRNSFLKTLLKNLRQIDQTKIGSKLLSKLQNSPRNIFIRPGGPLSRDE